MGLISYSLDYDTKTVTEYERTGECNGCNGETRCCRMKFTYQVEIMDGEPDDVNRAQGGGILTDKKGVWQGVVRDGKFVTRKLVSAEDTGEVCPLLTMGKCGNYVGRGGFCENYPLSPADTILIPTCSYTFRILRQWRITSGEVDTEQAPIEHTYARMDRSVS